VGALERRDLRWFGGIMQDYSKPIEAGDRFMHTGQDAVTACTFVRYLEYGIGEPSRVLVMGVDRVEIATSVRRLRHPRPAELAAHWPAT